MHRVLGKISSDNILQCFILIFSQKTRFDILCKLSPLETICMKCQILFSGKNKKNVMNLLFAEFACSMLSVNEHSLK